MKKENGGVLFVRYDPKSIEGEVIEELKRISRSKKININSVINNLILMSELEKLNTNLVNSEVLKELCLQFIRIYSGKLETIKCLLLSIQKGGKNFESEKVNFFQSSNINLTVNRENNSSCSNEEIDNPEEEQENYEESEELEVDSFMNSLLPKI